MVQLTMPHAVNLRRYVALTLPLVSIERFDFNAGSVYCSCAVCVDGATDEASCCEPQALCSTYTASFCPSNTLFAMLAVSIAQARLV